MLDPKKKKLVISLGIIIPTVIIALIFGVVLGLLFFLKPPPACSGTPTSGPYFHNIYFATSSDGLNWSVNQTVLFEHASVPGAVYLNGSIFLYYVNAESGEKLSVAISTDNGSSFTVYDVEISGSNSPRPVDPNPIVDGTNVRLTYLGNLDSSPHNIVTAWSADGVHFTEDGIIYSDDEITDPDLFSNATNDWVLFVNKGATLIKATCTTATGTFSKDSSFNFSGGWLASTAYINGKNYTYLHDGTSIGVAEYNDTGLTYIAKNLITGLSGTIADPTVAVLGSGDYIMYFKQCDTC